MGFFSRLFGGKEKTEQKVEIEPVEYKGFNIYQDAIAESGQYRVAGRIEKEFDGEIKTHRFIRLYLTTTNTSSVLFKEQEKLLLITIWMEFERFI